MSEKLTVGRIEFAPGPWRVGEVRHGLDCLVRNRDNDPVAATNFAGYNLRTCAANARLIAAAPDLLVALKECSFRLGVLIAKAGDFTDVNARALDQATAAIAKAEGR